MNPWPALLDRANRLLNDWDALEERTGIDRPPSGNFGFPGASADAIRAAEARLRLRLPPSLKAFYQVSNGWAPVGRFIYRVRAVEELGFLRELDADMYSLAEEAERAEGPWKDDPDSSRLNDYRLSQGTAVMRSLLLTSDGDAAMWLADPGRADSHGEWKVGRWSSWDPGIEWSHDTFLEIFEAEVSFLEESMKEK